MAIEIIVYGASDDLVELDGYIREEFSYGDEEAGDLLTFSDGTILRVLYTASGVWRITPVVDGSAELTIKQAPEDDEENYSDRATLTGDIAWIVHGGEVILQVGR